MGGAFNQQLVILSADRVFKRAWFLMSSVAIWSRKRSSSRILWRWAWEKWLEGTGLLMQLNKASVPGSSPKKINSWSTVREGSISLASALESWQLATKAARADLEDDQRPSPPQENGRVACTQGLSGIEHCNSSPKVNLRLLSKSCCQAQLKLVSKLHSSAVQALGLIYGAACRLILELDLNNKLEK